MRTWIVGALALGMVLAGVLSAYASPAPASNCLTCLGPQTNALWQGYVPLGGFKRYGKPLTKSLRQEVLYIDSGGAGSGASLWSLVKALDVFGTWKGARPADQGCQSNGICFIPSFDLSHATYRSRYATFVNVALYKGTHCVARLPAEAFALVKHLHWRLIRAHGSTQSCWNGPASTATFSADSSVPLLLTGGYLQAGVQVVGPGDFQGPAPGTPTGPPGSSFQQMTGLPFATVHDALNRNKPTDQVPPATLYDVNAEANLIEALICHAAKMQPKSACGRAVIKKLLKRIH